MLKKVKRIKLGRRAYRRIMKRVLERDDWRCQRCGSLENLQVHHQIKRSQQGKDSQANLVTLCSYCHMAEHGQLGYERGAARVISGTAKRWQQLQSSRSRSERTRRNIHREGESMDKSEVREHEDGVTKDAIGDPGNGQGVGNDAG